ncbi:hypothetical protein I4F81_012294 [Pyropia yezoensis]|uniref:Uncharacterized protein n=1 Tax=Pyropia yezoensis TaxID=2788 RepID=A0ACC3CIS6_PYRYE|nr:hypothetical protein I4F81_012294 [Neopyropia yezoensis]
MDATAPMGGGGSRRLCRRPCWEAAAAAAAVVTALAMVTGGAAAAAASARRAPAAAGPQTAVVHATPAAADDATPAQAAAAGDPITAAWLGQLQKRAAGSLRPLPTAYPFRRHDGLSTLDAGVGLAAGQVLLEVGLDCLYQPFLLATKYATLTAGAAKLVRLLDAMGVHADRIHTFRLAPNTDPPTMLLHRPPVDRRSVAPTTAVGRRAVAGIAGVTLMAFTGCPTADGRWLLIDLGPWVAALLQNPLTITFTKFVAHMNARINFVGGAGHPGHVTFSINLSAEGGEGGLVKVSAVGLPLQMIVPPLQDDRISYVATVSSWVHAACRPASGAHNMEWDIAKHPTFTFSVDPAGPRAYWPAVVTGVERWNPAFAAAGHDWPAAYAADDSRINTISFVAWAEASAAVGIKADPRTEEILNIDIVVGNALLWT